MLVVFARCRLRWPPLGWAWSVVIPVSVLVISSTAHAEDPASTEHSVTLGLRGFGGVRIEEDTGAVWGGALLAGAPVWRSLELEGSVAIAGATRQPAFAVLEVVGKWVFERESRWSPHLVLGPLVSMDIDESLHVSAGLVSGGGITYWFRDRWGWTTEANYRLLLGSEVAHVVVLSSGLSFRL